MNGMIVAPGRTEGDAFTGIPSGMKEARRWLLHRSKRPFYVDGTPRSGKLDTPEDQARFGTFDAAVAALDSGRYTGLGFALGPDGDGYWQGIDFDHLSEHPELQETSRHLPGYVERSPSGDGLHALGYGRRFDSLGSNGSGIEAYSAGRYFTVTGDAVGGDPEDLSTVVARTLAPMHAKGQKDSAQPPPRSLPVTSQHDPAFVEMCEQLGLNPASVIPLDSPNLPDYVEKSRRRNSDLFIEWPEDKERALSALYAISPDVGRHDWQRTVHAARATGLDLETVREWSAKSDKYDATDFEHLWNDFAPERPDAVRGATLFYIAKEAGWVDPEASTDTAKAAVDQDKPPPFESLTISAAELQGAVLTPRCIVENYLYADLAQLVAPGGTGKTTLILAEIIHIILGKPIWGLRVETPGRVLVITAEDARERLVARLRHLMDAKSLEADDQAQVVAGLGIWDVSGQSIRLAAMLDGNAVLTSLADEIVDAYKDDPPALVVFDPLVSFGASEQAVNDNEQALVTAGRRILRGLDCCVRYVHHTGKGNAREGTLDQYTGRGGSALADGTRMTAVLQAYVPGGDLKPPNGWGPDEHSSLTILARPKGSYAPPNQPLIWIRRTGWKYEYALPAPPVSGAQQLENDATTVERFLQNALLANEKHTKSTLEGCLKDLDMSRTRLRAALDKLKVTGRVCESNLPSSERRGGKSTYLEPTSTSPTDDGEVSPDSTDEEFP